MRATILALAAVAVLAVAAPASALTTQPVSETRAGPVATALFSDKVVKFADGASGYRAAIAGDTPSNPGLPVYFEPTDTAAANEDAYAADPVRFMSRVDASAAAPATSAAAKAQPNGR